MYVNFVKTALFMLALSLASTNAGAACTAPDLAGKWINPDPGKHELSSLEFTYNCGQKPIKAYDPLSAALWIAKAKIQCPRTECTWGRAKVDRYKSGEMRVTYSRFSAVYALRIVEDNKFLRVDVKTLYRDERRKPTLKTYYLHKEYAQ